MELAFKKYWHGDQPDPHLLLDWDDPEGEGRRRTAAMGAAGYHILLVVFALNAPSGVSLRQPPIPRVELTRSTPLVIPRLPKELTQKDPNKGKVAKELDLASLLPHPPVEATQPKAPGRTTPRQLQLPPSVGTAQPAPVIEAPKIDVPQSTQLAQGPAALGTELPPQERPKLSFERVGSAQGSSSGQAVGISKPKLEVPKAGVEEATRAAIRRGGNVVVGEMDMGGSIDMRQAPAPGKSGSSLELLSDPQGVDFKPYLVQILAAVRRNWTSVMPESARLGRSGRVAIQFAISKDGRVPKLVIAVPSGADALDRAAVAGISASNPFPPLPVEFRGDQIRLQLNFSYNMPAR